MSAAEPTRHSAIAYGKVIVDRLRRAVRVPAIPEISRHLGPKLTGPVQATASGRWNRFRIRGETWILLGEQVPSGTVCFPESSALLEVQRLLSDPTFRSMALKFCRNVPLGACMPSRAMSEREMRQVISAVFADALRNRVLVVTNGASEWTGSSVTSASPASGQSVRSDEPRVLIVRRRDVRPDERRLPSSLAISCLEKLLPDISSSQAVLELLGAEALVSSSSSAQEVLRKNRSQLRHAISGGELVLISPLRFEGSGSSGKKEAEVEEQESQASTSTQVLKKTWVEFEVVDMEGNPVSQERYLVMLPDGSLNEGWLDPSGVVRFNNIDPDTCVFSLPDLDEEAWERAG